MNIAVRRRDIKKDTINLMAGQRGSVFLEREGVATVRRRRRVRMPVQRLVSCLQIQLVVCIWHTAHVVRVDTIFNLFFTLGSWYLGVFI